MLSHKFAAFHKLLETHLILRVQLISSFSLGSVFPIPTFPDVFTQKAVALALARPESIWSNGIFVSVPCLVFPSISKPEAPLFNAALTMSLLCELAFPPIPTFPPEKEKFETRVSKSSIPSIIRFQELAVRPDQFPTLSETESPPLRAPYQIERMRTVRKKVNPM